MKTPVITAKFKKDYKLSAKRGYDEGIKNGINLGNVNNQNFVNVPIGSIKKKLSYLCEFYRINFIKQEESYTSKASFFDKDIIPTYDPKNYQKLAIRFPNS